MATSSGPGASQAALSMRIRHYVECPSCGTPISAVIQSVPKRVTAGVGGAGRMGRLPAVLLMPPGEPGQPHSIGRSKMLRRIERGIPPRIWDGKGSHPARIPAAGCFWSLNLSGSAQIDGQAQKLAL